MMNIPEILSVQESAQKIELRLNIAKELSAFAGHFESAPIVPGVVQIQWVLIFAQKYLNYQAEILVERIDALKFQQVIQPETQVNLTLEYDAQLIKFVFHSDESKHSSGKIVLS